MGYDNSFTVGKLVIVTSIGSKYSGKIGIITHINENTVTVNLGRSLERDFFNRSLKILNGIEDYKEVLKTNRDYNGENIEYKKDSIIKVEKLLENFYDRVNKDENDSRIKKLERTPKNEDYTVLTKILRIRDSIEESLEGEDYKKCKILGEEYNRLISTLDGVKLKELRRCRMIKDNFVNDMLKSYPIS